MITSTRFAMPLPPLSRQLIVLKQRRAWYEGLQAPKASQGDLCGLKGPLSKLEHLALTLRAQVVRLPALPVTGLLLCPARQAAMGSASTVVVRTTGHAIVSPHRQPSPAEPWLPLETIRFPLLSLKRAPRLKKPRKQNLLQKRLMKPQLNSLSPPSDGILTFTARITMMKTTDSLLVFS